MVKQICPQLRSCPIFVVRKKGMCGEEEGRMGQLVLSALGGNRALWKPATKSAITMRRIITET